MQTSGNPAESVEPELFVQHLSLINNGGFIARFVVQRLVGGRLISQTNAFGNIQLGQTRTVDLSALRFHNQALDVGDRVRLRVGAAGGTRRNGPEVSYAPNGQTAAFNVRGTTLVFSINPL
ncbi:hypothetical protein J5226_00260 [Lysobacter sp. K5869]|uniref:hypothetical protein n=1 Tax=Lysobacter sp. K5869 TaxID=2820808 RepID=UPI001C061B37|nr:hypothetical protein [Lysobacter sp. K5869]QWP76884.1 hypothetical protein J5226_00260 [Lysobacter sp. K5869]